MTDSTALYCPECGFSVQKMIGEVDLHDEFKCDMCGESMPMHELKTAWGQRLVDHMMALAADKFHTRTEYKPRSN
jgi:hypothetical protein